MSNNIHLPENAFRPLKEGEKYVPIVHKEKGVLEVTVYSVIMGFFMGLIFSCAAAYIALKLGQGIETAIPIAILAVGGSAILAKKNALLENVNVLAIGATSGIIVGGSVFTMPAIYILGIEGLSGFFQIFIVPFFGAVLGVLFLIPFRRYFVSEQHGHLPFPEATATTEVLVTGERGGDNAKVLTGAIILGGVFDFLAVSMQAWAENFTTSAIKGLSLFTDKLKMVFSLNTSAAIAGLGYLIGVRYAMIIFTGSMMSCFVIVPLFAYLGNFINVPIIPAKVLISTMSADDIYYNYARYIGIGGIFAAGVISILKMSKVIVNAIKQVISEMFKSKHKKEEGGEKSRLDTDINMSVVFGLMAVMFVVIFLYFKFAVLKEYPNGTMLAFIAVLVTFVIGFLFTSVSAWAIAMISVTPISGMTLMTLIVTAIIFSQMGLKGPHGMLATLLIGGVVCTALSMAGTLVTEFKIGYWLGSTPRIIQWSNIIGAVFASVAVTIVIMLLAKVYGFCPSPDHLNPLPAPQPNAMAAVISSLMSEGGAPWFLYGLGAVFAVIVEFLGISGLAFALGMYIPMELNSPILVGALVAWLVNHSTKDKNLAKARHDRGILIASGLIAGGALIGVISAVIKFFEDKYSITIVKSLNNTGSFGNILGIVLFLALCAYIYWDSRRAKSEK
ncbi:MAG: oligopeptide transporter, OPT family [Armatimonadota bacterium]